MILSSVCKFSTEKYEFVLGVTMGRVLVLIQVRRAEPVADKHTSQHKQPNKHGNESAAGGAFALTRLQIAPRIPPRGFSFLPRSFSLSCFCFSTFLSAFVSEATLALLNSLLASSQSFPCLPALYIRPHPSIRNHRTTIISVLPFRSDKQCHRP